MANTGIIFEETAEVVEQLKFEAGQFVTIVKADDLSIFFDTTGVDSLDDKKKHSITVVIGPEGGFTEDERQIAIDNGYSVIRSGPRLLRTETAPIMALSILQYLYGDLSN